MQLKDVTHVIFDVDGLLIESETAYTRINTEIAASYGEVYTLDIKLKILGTPEQETARLAVTEMNLPLTPEEFLKIYKEKVLIELANPLLMPGARELVKHLYKNDIPIAVATSSSWDSMVLKTKDHQDVFKLFSHIVCGSTDPEVKNGKPSPDIFLVCASRFPGNPDPSKVIRVNAIHLYKNDIPIAVATSSSWDSMVLKTKDHQDVFKLFSHIVCGSTDPEVKNGKPSPDIFLVCASRFPGNPDPSKCLVLEDSPTGVRGARSAGMQAVMVPSKDVTQELRKPATMVLESLHDFKPEMFGLPARG